MKFMLAIALFAICATGCKKEEAWGVQGFVGGTELHRICGSKSPVNRQECYFYILGVVDTQNSVSTADDPWLCGEPKRHDIANAVMGHLKAHPDQTSVAAADIVWSAVDKAYGCKNKR